VSHYSDRPGHCRVDFFKPSGKWYTTEAVDFDDFYHEPLIHDAFHKALKKHFNGMSRLAGMTAVCLEPYHEHEHPLMVTVKESYD
jgi:hypothetical protein